MAAKSNPSDSPKRRERTASVSYPYHPLGLCIEVGNAVREIGNGKSEVSKSLLASRLGISEQATDFAAKIASTKSYGIIDGKSSLSLTATAKNYFFPTMDPEAEKKEALLKFLSSPGAFNQLINLYDGTVPSLEIMGNVLHRQMGIPDSWKDRVAKFFVRSAEFAGAMDGGFLRFKARLETVSNGSGSAGHHHAAGSHAQKQIVQPQQDPPPKGETDAGVIVWSYPCDGKFLRIETPQTLTREVWEKLKRYIDVLEP